MRNRRFTYLIFFIMLCFMAVLASCQKDSDVKDNSATKTSLAADSSASPANLLATSGTLSITIKDSTYLFDAAKDSIAFINVHDDNDDDKRYFGITAINKEHNMSFGISSTGYAHADKSGDIAGGLVACIGEIGTALATHFPYRADVDKNELPDEIVFGK